MAHSISEDRGTNRIGWLSLDDDDNDYSRFVSYFVGALQSIELEDEPAGKIGKEAIELLALPQPPPPQEVLTPVLNQISAIADRIILVLDDYHFIETEAIHTALAFVMENMPDTMHLVIATRQDPPFALARIRAQGKMNEVRAADLRFSAEEVSEFMRGTMDLDLTTEQISRLEARTEGWAVGLQLAAISLSDTDNAAALIETFAGSHRHVTDFLLQEVLSRQPEKILTFLLQTSMLERLCGPLCDAVTEGHDGREVLQGLEQANMFVVPLDGERRWYRYHHLFADLLRQRSQESATAAGAGNCNVRDLHIRASEWFEANDLEVEAFHHAAAGNDVARAERLIEGGGLPLPMRGVVAPVLDWLASLTTTALNERPSLWVTYAMTALIAGDMSGVEEKLDAAEAAIRGAEPNDEMRDLTGRVADMRGTIAVGHRQAETILAQSRRALEYLGPDNLNFRTSSTWKLGVAYELQGDRAAAGQAFAEAMSISQASGNIYTTLLAATGVGDIQLSSCRLDLAEETYLSVLKLLGDLPIPVGCHVHLCLAKIHYEWDNMDTAQQHWAQAADISRPYADQFDVLVACQVFRARLCLARGDVAGAATILVEAKQSVRDHNYEHQAPAVAGEQVLVLLQQGDIAEAADLAEKHGPPIALARVQLVKGEPSVALALLEPVLRQAEERGWDDQRLKVLVLQTLAFGAAGDVSRAYETLEQALALAEPGGFVRIFLDEGPQMVRMLYEAAARGIAPAYTKKLLASKSVTDTGQTRRATYQVDQSDLPEPLSEREIELLQLISDGLSNRDVGDKLFISLHTVKAHTRNIYAKLEAHNRTEAVAKARAFGLLPPS